MANSDQIKDITDEDLEKTFAKFDKNKNDKIEKDEIMDYVKEKLGVPVNSK